MQDKIMQDKTLTDKISEQDIAGHDNVGQQWRELENDGHDKGGQRCGA